jgi:prolyl-tRNA editing enzyme YbaK/EbsC (Cys-tRNA(Pro) deacylase)
MATTPEDDGLATAVQDLTRWLDGAGVGWRLVSHPPAASAAEEAVALARPAEMVAKTVVVRDAGRLVSVVVPASERIDPARLTALLEGDDLLLAHEDEIVRAAPAYELGALPPCGPGVPPTVVVDARLLDYGHVLCAAGVRDKSVALDPEDIVRLTGARVVDVSVDRL